MRQIRLVDGNPYALHAMSTEAGIITFYRGVASVTNKQLETLRELEVPFEEVEGEGLVPGAIGLYDEDALRSDPPENQVPALDPTPKALDDLTEVERAHEGLPNAAAMVVNPHREDEYEEDVAESHERAEASSQGEQLPNVAQTPKPDYTDQEPDSARDYEASKTPGRGLNPSARPKTNEPRPKR